MFVLQARLNISVTKIYIPMYINIIDLAHTVRKYIWPRCKLPMIRDQGWSILKANAWRTPYQFNEASVSLVPQSLNHRHESSSVSHQQHDSVGRPKLTAIIASTPTVQLGRISRCLFSKAAGAYAITLNYAQYIITEL